MQQDSKDILHEKMYYHIRILKKHSTNVYEFDKTNLDEIIDSICIPYLKKLSFFFDHQLAQFDDIVSIIIVKTANLSTADPLSMFNNGNNVFTSKNSFDITPNVFLAAQKKLNSTPLTPNKNGSKEYLGKLSVFIVHGHDDLAKTEVARFIEKLGFQPIILHEQVSSGKTIIEKIEINSNVGFGIVLYTPCDVGAVKEQETNLQSRARQNVVFEHGYLIGKLGRENVCALVKGKIELPNDMSGIVYTPMDSHKAWQYKVADEMKALGYRVDKNKL